MKDNYNYPKTLRSYNQLASYNLNQKLRTLEQQSHNINQNCMLSNSKQVSKKVKSKKQKKATDLNSAIQKKLSQSKSTYEIVMTQNYDHCKSLQRLQLISNDRGHQIKKRMQQNGKLTAENQQLKTKLSNPTFRDGDLVEKIYKYELEIHHLKDMLRKKDQQLSLQRQQNKQSMIQICKLHKQEIIRIKQQYSRALSHNRQNITEKIYSNNRQNTSEKTYGKKQASNPIKIFKSYQNQRSEARNIPSDYKVYTSPSTNSHQIKQVNFTQNINKDMGKQIQNVTSYIGEDGYERRIIRPNKQQTVKFTNPMIYNNINSVSNDGITFNRIQQQKNTQLRRVRDHQWQTQTANHNPQLGYSSSLTYQCFNDTKI